MSDQREKKKFFWCAKLVYVIIIRVDQDIKNIALAVCFNDTDFWLW